MSDHDEPAAGDPPPDRERAEAPPGAAAPDLARLCQRLVARSSDVRGDAQRSLDRASELYQGDDSRSSIAVSACRDALEAYRDAVDRSVRDLCEPGHGSQRGGIGATLDEGRQPAPPARGRARERIAAALGVAGVVAALGLVAWASLPSWPSLTGSSTGAPVGSAAAPPETASSLSAAAEATALGERPARGRERWTARTARAGDVRRVVVSTLPGTGAGAPPAAGAASGADGAASSASGSPGADAGASAGPPGSAGGPDEPSAGDGAGGTAPAGAGGSAGSPPGADGAAGAGDGAQRVREAVDAVQRRLPEVDERLGEALEATSDGLLSEDGSGGDERAGEPGEGEPGAGAGGLLEALGASGDEAAATGADG